eukprot:CAMPEP_0176410492 /NCGR_PEP_ID=MMETSP0127-20121128/3085_1 /TAXON_ID=938130 /ORGANISM="Platyophrya macrostoma, Strain WH" /LENGTH=181 /DNA_ID=CAMNT_0017789991 /DNA_START=9 /DNA_END=554 /DNA_ORIENTATION=-
MCMPFETVPPPNEKSQNLVSKLKYICLLQLILALLEIFTNPFTGLNELFAVFILYQAYSTISYCSLIVYVFFCSMNLMQYLLGFGNLWQNHQMVKDVVFPFVVAVIASIFYPIAIYLAFLAYREFKAIAMSGAPAGGVYTNATGNAGGGLSQPFNRYNNRPSKIANSHNHEVVSKHSQVKE